MSEKSGLLDFEESSSEPYPRLLIIILLVLIFGFPVFANPLERKIEIDTALFVNCGQKIIYDFGMYSEQPSVYGFGTDIGIMYNLHERFALGTDFGCESFIYKDFSDFRDFKLSAEMRIRINSLKNDFFSWFVNFRVGTDYVVREDDIVSLYYLHGFGSSCHLKMKDNLYFVLGCDMEVSLQIGSDVSHYTHYMGVSWVKD